jgi:hypothetical protein
MSTSRQMENVIILIPTPELPIQTSSYSYLHGQTELASAVHRPVKGVVGKASRLAPEPPLSQTRPGPFVSPNADTTFPHDGELDGHLKHQTTCRPGLGR